MSHLSMLFLFSCLAYTYSFTPILKQLNYSELYSFNVNSSVEYILNFSNPSSYFQKQVGNIITIVKGEICLCFKNTIFLDTFTPKSYHNQQ